ncbi:MurR/RpiR family transcriptional regulator [Pseudooceanicola sp. CBS1P-1]|uniref:SIS domain-containing protein n=1 Tax=Pseudooceanicola albus TaxID=2692189 RepID=A0A6L7G809_9RHOB|nr:MULTISPECIES: MurR/RpiR family transcriptional regulator [Pseudooceanicola]MBT9385901.1 MurR/RpiR family transcriptional regulator [Pseudooceanicola endophyticus]MXN19678.1 SIS domain-containing protein [Pseudooceanicola albus]
MSEYQDLQDRLKRGFPDLPPALQTAATYVLEHPGNIATLSMRQVAADTGISLGNFPRLAKALGYDTYNELRSVFSTHVQTGSVGDYHIRAGALQEGAVGDGLQATWQEFRDAAHRNVDALFEQNHLSAVNAAAGRLAQARRIYVVGMQASLSSAIYAKYLGSMVSERFRIVSGQGGVFADDIAEIGPEDAVLAVSMRPSSEFTIRVARAGRAAGAHVVALTDSDAAPLALSAQEVLLIPNRSPMFFDSYLGVTLMLEVLLGFLTMQSPDAVARIENMENRRRAMGEYWQDRDI